MLRLTLPGLALVLAACEPPPLDGPSITILYPESSDEDGTVYCSTFMVVVDIDNFVLSEDVGGTNVDGEGHWHLMDSETYLTATAEEYAFVPGDKALATGRHEIVAVLANNDHQLLDPETSYLIEVDVGETQTDGVTPCVGSGGDTGGSGY